MQLNKIIFENYGPYKRKNEFNLAPGPNAAEHRSIVLFGGKNGAGKTSIIEGVRLCLYGPWFNGKMKKKEYDNFIKKRMHQPLDSPDQAKSSSITLEFVYSQLGIKDLYKVKRSWERGKGGLKEKLEIFKNNSLIIDLDSDQWQDFINELIPRGVSNLFFFDGEKIQDLANDTENNVFLFDSFKSLLGLDIVEKLGSDLSIIKRRKQKEDASKETLIGLNDLENEKDKFINSIDNLTQKKGELRSKLDHIEKEIERHEQKLSSEGGKFAIKRNKLKKDRDRLEFKIDETEEKIREITRGLFPLSITPKYLKKLKTRLKKEEEYLSKKTSQEILQKKISKIDRDIKTKKFWKGTKLDDDTKSSILEKLSDSFQRVLEDSKGIKDLEIIHDVSSSEKNKFFNWIDLSLDEVPKKLKNESNKLEKSIKKLQSIQDKIDKAPSEEAIKPLVDKLSELNRSQGEISGEINRIKNDIGKKDFYFNDLQRKIKKLQEKLDLESSNVVQVDLINKVRDVLSIYEKKMKKSSTQSLQDSFMECYSALSRKKDVIRHIHVDPKDFSIKLFNRGGNEVSKDHHLSAGEKQLYAISMLWALMKTANRDLPLIIDTPLARLDRGHRDNIVKNFFPRASNQTIILSTDTEVDKKYFEDLKPFISHSYHLEFDSDTGHTNIQKGYFSEIEEVAN